MDIFSQIIYILQGKNIYKIHHFIILLIIYINFSFTKSFSFVRSFTLRSGNVILINENGIYYYNKKTENEEEIILFNSTYQADRNADYDYADMAQFPSNEFIIFRLKEKLYFIKNEKNYQCEITIQNISEIRFISIFPISNENSEKYTFGIASANSSLILNLYEINLNEQEKCNLNNIKSMEISLINSLNYPSATNQKGVICGMMYYYIFDYEILACFSIHKYPVEISICSFDPKNDYQKISDLKAYYPSNYGVLSFKGIFNEGKTKILICSLNSNNQFYCVIFDVNKKEWSKSVNILIATKDFMYSSGVFYISNNNEYIFYGINSKTYEFIRLNENFAIINESSNKTNCKSQILVDCNTLDGNALIYSDSKYYYLSSFSISDYSGIKLTEISDTCNTQTDEDIKFYNETAYESPDSDNNAEEIFREEEEKEEIEESLEQIEKKEYEENIEQIKKGEKEEKEEIKIDKTKEEEIKEQEKEENEKKNEKIEEIKEKKEGEKMESIKEEEAIQNIYKNEIIHIISNNTKEYIIQNLDEFLENIEIGKIYKVSGEDYDIKISPINYKDQNKSTSIDLKECGEILKKQYNLSEESLLTIFQIEIEKKNNQQSLTNQVEYEILDEEKNRLNLYYCRNVSIIINYKINDDSLIDTNLINYYSEKGIDILNIKDDFFNNLCFQYSENSTDIILKDRIKDIYQNYSKCDYGCEYKNLDVKSMEISCECQIKENMTLETEEPTFAEAVTDTFKNSNIGVIRCYELLMSFDNIKSNIGFWVFLILTIIHIPLFIYFLINGITSIKSYISNELLNNNYYNTNIKKNPPIKKYKNNKKNNPCFFSDDKSNDKPIPSSRNQLYASFRSPKCNKRIKNKKNTTKKIINNKNGGRDNQKDDNKVSNNLNINNEKKKHSLIIFNYNENSINMNCKKSKKMNDKFPKSKKKQANKGKKKIQNENEKLLNNFRLSEKKKSNNKNSKIKGGNKQIDYKDYCIIIKMDANNSQKKREPYESKYILDNYEYSEAIKYEDRSFWRILLICLLYKENILNSFFFKSPLLLKSLRICLFIFHYSCDFALNAIFYLNGNISDRYNYDGDALFFYTFINNIVISVCSTLVSYFLAILFRYLIYSKKEIRNVFRKEEYKMKKNKKYFTNATTKNLIIHEIQRIYKILKIKIVFFMVLEFLLMILFWYYVSTFCAVYKETQESWLIDSFTSLIFSVFVKFTICVMLSSLYITAIKYKMKLLYEITMFVYNLG